MAKTPMSGRKNAASKNVDLSTIHRNPGAKMWDPTGEDYKKIRNLSAMQCTYAEIAAALHISKPTLEGVLKRGRDYIFALESDPGRRATKGERIGVRVMHELDEGRENGKTSLRSSQFKMALNGNTQMSIHLGKQYLGHSDKQEMTGKDGTPLNTPPEVNINFVGMDEKSD